MGVSLISSVAALRQETHGDVFRLTISSHVTLCPTYLQGGPVQSSIETMGQLCLVCKSNFSGKHDFSGRRLLERPTM